MRMFCGALWRKKRMAYTYCAAVAGALLSWCLTLSGAEEREAEKEPGKQIVVSYAFERPSVTVTKGRARLSAQGLSLLVEEGKPIIPFKTARILLPPSGAIVSVEVSGWGLKHLAGRFEVELGQAPQPTRPDTSRTTSRQAPDFEQEKPYPGRLHDVASVQKLRGYRMAIVRLYPVQYVAATGQVSYYEGLTVALNVSSISGDAAKAADTGMFRGSPLDEARAGEVVDNPEMVKAYPRGEQESWQKRTTVSGKLEAGAAVTGNTCEYLIITTTSFAEKFVPLLEWKTKKGMTGRIATVEEVKNNYEGEDIQDRIRKFITECYRSQGTQYVLLGGDTEIIPERGTYGEVGSYEDEHIPCDLYYGCLDGTWDHDGDWIYGESGDGENGGEVDLVAEVYVGRAPVSTPREAENFVKKTLWYEVHRIPNLSHALWIGQALDSRTWGSDSKEELVVLLPKSFEVIRLYQKDGSYSVEGVIAALNAHPHIVNHLGHSTESSLLGLSKSDVDDLGNVYPFFLYSQGCDAGAFDKDDAVTEHFVKNGTGAFAVVANSRYGWYSPETTLGTSQKFDRAFLEAIFNEQTTNLGKALQESKEANIGDVLQTGAARWCYFGLNLLGDPETPLFTATSNGLLSFDQARYSPRNPMVVELADIDLNTHPLVTETFAIKLTSPRDTETIVVQETTSNSGVFVGEVPLSTGLPSVDGILQVRDGDVVSGVYEDADDGKGSSQTVTATAMIDDSPPIISKVRVADVRDTWAVIEWDSNEPATARVDYGVSPPFGSSAQSDVVTKSHGVIVSGLVKETEYWFRVAAIDMVGNETIDENRGSYYYFKTKYQVFVFSDDVEEGGASAAGEWTYKVISGAIGDWQITTDDFRSETSCWHSDDYPFPSANVLDSPLIDLRGMTTAQLSFWHRMLSETNWDGGFVQVQREGTEDWHSLTQEQMAEGTPFVTLSTGNPSGAVPGWSGNIPWERVTFDLSGYVGDRVRIRFRLESDDNTDAGEGDGWYIDDVMVSRAMGTVNLDKRFYRLGDAIVITVLDPVANIDPESVETVSVEVSSALEIVPEIVMLAETGANTSTFIGEIVTAKGGIENDGKLGVSHEDMIIVSYGGAEPMRATADLLAPTILKVQSTQVTDYSAIIKWETNEECRGAVHYGRSPTGLDQVKSEAVSGRFHELMLKELEPRTTYYFKVESVDRAGNSAIDDNNGNLYTFLTLGFAQGGVIDKDTVWRYVDGHPYVINGSLYVGTSKREKLVTLTIEPGVVVQFRTSKKDMFIRGRILARGVTFEFDLPSGKSAHMIFEEGSSGVIENSVISVLGTSEELSGGIECYSSQVEFTNNIVRNAYYGFHCLSCSPRISSNTFIVCNYAVFLHAAAGQYSSPEIKENTFMGCKYPIFCETGAYPVVAGNVFDGNRYDGLVHSMITTDTIWPGYDCGQFLTGDLAVPADKTLLIAPGARICMAQPGTDLFVSGNLYAEGATIEFAVPPEPRTFVTFSSTSTGAVRNCRIVGRSPDGTPSGGIKCQSSAVSFTGNVISGTYYGIFCGSSKSPLIANNTIVGCTFGIYAPDATPRVTNCILWNNGDDLFGCSGTFLDTMDGNPGEGNISLDPLFRDAAKGDFRVLRESPCIDSGTSQLAPLLDAVGYVRWDDPGTPNTGGGSRPYFDIGAYEFVADADGDMMCDEWEVVNGFNPSEASDALADGDGDGKSNVEEYVCGTDPGDPWSCLRVVTLAAVEEESWGIMMAWPTVAGRRYRVVFTESLWPPQGRKFRSDGISSGEFADLTMWKPCSEVLEGAGGVLKFFDKGDSGRESPSDLVVRSRFYRAVVW